ncbi:hypothetical protein [Armatimonas rosea]|uniref:Uncharacterized protein n=1 Tax=Armatimonas rosea TaxID=685828 RepID=A0A7W9SN76_ARMRO|nr:hypothetical protein [Armatimonas rosea]MBB6048959.1 hypothetical protein [Armatimonas rosea]
MDETPKRALARLQGMLELMALLSSGPDCQPTYELTLLPPAANLAEALEQYFSSLSTSLSPKQPASAWNIRTEPCTPSQLRESWAKWFWQEYHSPPITDAHKREFILDRLWETIEVALGDVALHQVLTDPPIFYECHWEDFALVSSSGVWLLHLGSSD